MGQDNVAEAAQGMKKLGCHPVAVIADGKTPDLRGLAQISELPELLRLQVQPEYFFALILVQLDRVYRSS